MITYNLSMPTILKNKSPGIIPLSQPIIGQSERQAVNSVLRSGRLAQGSQVALFEQEFAKTCHAKYAIAVSSGTAALHLALLAHHLGPGDEVITTPFTFVATTHAIIHTGATPVFVDIDEKSFNINPIAIEQAITVRTKAILPVHLFGHPCRMPEITRIAHRHRLTIIEDAAQALGAAYRDKPIGSNNTTCFSLYATKNITTGEGGMITTNNTKIADLCRLLRNHGMRQRNDVRLVGYNYRMTDIAAAIGIQQFKKLPKFNNQRRSNAEYYNQHLKTVTTPITLPDAKHSWHLYTVLFPNKKKRDAAHQQLADKGISTGIFYDPPLHLYPHLKQLTKCSSPLPVATNIASRVLSLPIHPHVSQQQLHYIADTINSLSCKN